MITLETISTIVTGMAWAEKRDLFQKTDFTVNVTLPFPFYDALQRELYNNYNSKSFIVSEIPLGLPYEQLKFTKLRFANGMQANIMKGDDKIIFEVAPKAKVIPMNPDNGYLKPFGGDRA